MCDQRLTVYSFRFNTGRPAIGYWPLWNEFPNSGYRSIVWLGSRPATVARLNFFSYSPVGPGLGDDAACEAFCAVGRTGRRIAFNRWPKSCCKNKHDISFRARASKRKYSVRSGRDPDGQSVAMPIVQTRLHRSRASHLTVGQGRKTTALRTAVIGQASPRKSSTESRSSRGAKAKARIFGARRSIDNGARRGTRAPTGCPTGTYNPRANHKSI